MTLSVNNGYDINRDYFKSNENGFTPYTQEEFINKIKTDDKFAKKWGYLGPIYGKQWRAWGEGGWSSWTDINDNVMHKHKTVYLEVDQIANLINDLKTNPDSRRLMVNAWNVGELDEMVLPPCHYGFQVYTRELSLDERKKLVGNKTLFLLGSEKDSYDEANIPQRAISLMWNQRSVDTFLGLPFNIASYGLLLEILAKEVNMVPDELIGNLGDVHLYNNHIEQAKEQIGRLTLEERRAMVTQDEFNKVYTGGSPDTLSHSEIDQFGVTRRTREPFELPKLGMDYREGEYDKNLKDFVPDDFYLIDYQSHPTIKAPLSN
jgi:thymidylate synthase